MACGNKCSCENRSIFEPCGDLLECCEHCPSGAPCGYAILSKCLYYKHGLFLHHITPLWKNCLFDCTWSARRCLRNADGTKIADCIAAYGGVLASTAHLQSISEWLGCDDPDNDIPDESVGGFPGPPLQGVAHSDDCPGESIVQAIPPVCSDGGDLKATSLSMDECGGQLRPADSAEYRCGWHDWYELGYTCADGPTYWADYLDTCTYKAWQLEVTSLTTATLTGYYPFPGPGGVVVTNTVVYECNEWQCVPEITGAGNGEHGNTFQMVDYPNQDHLGLPRFLCVVPYSSNFRTPCETQADACACGDPGWDNFCLDVSGVECGSISSYGLISLTRSLSGGFDDVGGLDLSGDISAPSPAPCGYFVSGLMLPACDHAEDGSGMVFVVWCDGSNWNIAIYCVMYTGTTVDSVTEVCNTTFTVTEICPDGMRGTFDCGAITSECCPSCGNVETPCCEEGIPQTLYVDLVASGCDTFEGGTTDTVTVTLTYGGGDSWSGTVTSSDWGMLTGCGELTVTYRVDGLLSETPSCIEYLTITGPGGTCFTDAGANPSCPDLGTVFSGTWDGTNCACCPTVSVTATVYS